MTPAEHAQEGDALALAMGRLLLCWLSPRVVRRLVERLERAERLGHEVPLVLIPRAGRHAAARFGHTRPREEVCE